MADDEQQDSTAIFVRTLSFSAIDELVLASLIKQQYGWLRLLFPFVRHRESLRQRAYKRILTDVNVCFRAGRFTAIMGASGAGKTTLLSAIAGKTSRQSVSGVIRFKEKGTIGFVFQNDLILDTMTVKEAVDMSARLRLSKTLEAAFREGRVDETLREMYLTKAAGTRIAGISGGERKRTSIAMELITEPDVLFLDEPTSGLDTYTAFSIVKSLTRFAHRNEHVVVATIHQPSSEIFHLFDDLLLLSAGRVVYSGPADGAIAYFERLGYKFPQFTNPADYIFMHILNVGDPEEVAARGGEVLSAESLQETWNSSDENHRLLMQIDQGLAESQDTGVPMLKAHITASFGTQFAFLSSRASKNAFRNELIIRVRLIQTIFIGVLAGLVFINATDGTVAAQIQSISGFLYFLAVNQFFGSATAVLSIFATEKAVFLREFWSGYYGLTAYYLSKVLVELPHQIVFPMLLVLIAYYIVGLKPAFSAYLLTGLLLVLCSICGTAVGTLIAACFDEVGLALAVLPLFILPVLLFSGLFVNSGNFPVWLGWLQWTSPVRYAFSSSIVNQFTGYTFNNCSPQDSPECSGERAISQLGFQNDLPIGVNISIMLGIYVLLVVGGYLALFRKTRK